MGPSQVHQLPCLPLSWQLRSLCYWSFLLPCLPLLISGIFRQVWHVQTNHSRDSSVTFLVDWLNKCWHWSGEFAFHWFFRGVTWIWWDPQNPSLGRDLIGRSLTRIRNFWFLIIREAIFVGYWPCFGRSSCTITGYTTAIKWCLHIILGNVLQIPPRMKQLLHWTKGMLLLSIRCLPSVINNPHLCHALE